MRATFPHPIVDPRSYINSIVDCRSRIREMLGLRKKYVFLPRQPNQPPSASEEQTKQKVLMTCCHSLMLSTLHPSLFTTLTCGSVIPSWHSIGRLHPVNLSCVMVYFVLSMTKEKVWRARYCAVVMWCDVMWCDVMWCDVMWCDVMWCDVMWCALEGIGGQKNSTLNANNSLDVLNVPSLVEFQTDLKRVWDFVNSPPANTRAHKRIQILKKRVRSYHSHSPPTHHSTHHIHHKLAFHLVWVVFDPQFRIRRSSNQS
jgi:hypothetical protein